MMENGQVKFLVNQIIEAVFEGSEENLSVERDRYKNTLPLIVFLETWHIFLTD
jgi:hypothetical protein